MHFSISPPVDAPLQAELESLLQPFLEQSAPIRSIVAVGCHRILGITRDTGSGGGAVLLRLVADEDGGPAIIPQQAYTLDSLARQARELSGPVPVDDLLLLPAHVLDQMMTPLADDFSFRAVAALLPQVPDQFSDGNGWRLRRSLFDRGLVCIGSVDIAGSKALCFLASEAVRSVDHLDVESRGHITMSGLLVGGRFANQLFRYACVKMYALRHGLTPALPEWEGNQLYGLKDKSCGGLALPKLTYNGFVDEREFWDRDDPPIDIDLEGYFQETPECWRRHRPLLRRIFEPVPEHLHAIDAWHRNVTSGGRRTLVAIHVRRTDYRFHQNRNSPWFRIVPVECYLGWLRAIWPTLRDPLLFIGTDEPDTILPLCQEFETISPTFGQMSQALPEHVRDFEVMRRADYLAICNSSYSRMAAILAPSTQKCFLPSFQTQSFQPYEPWMDPGFWPRFTDSWNHTNLRGKLQGPGASISPKALDESLEPAGIFVDVTDLLLYLLHQTTLSGIQRVQCEMLGNLLDIAHPQPVHFVVLDKRGGLCTIETSALLDIIEEIRSDSTSRADIESELHGLLDRAFPCTVRCRDIFLTIGAFWNVSGVGVLLQNLKNSGVIVGVFIHDIIPIEAPEFFEAASTSLFMKGVMEALTFADFILTTSEHNKASLTEHMASAKFDPVPVHVVPLGHELSLSAPIESKISSVVAGILDTEYVLCVGTIEVRKNPAYLFHMWKMMVRSGRPGIPTLVFVGRKGWLIQDFLHQLKACNYLGGKILVVHNVTDVELDLLYRNCILTVFPSFLEGWGLPVGESLGHGKICITSDRGGIPDVGGKLVDYIDPYNARDGLQQLLRYLDHPELRHSREREIAEHFKPRSWQEATNDFLRATQVLAGQVRPFETVAAIMLPPGQYLPISSDSAAITTDEVDRMLSAKLICISGWHPAEIPGVRANQPTAMVRFRADAPEETRINLVLRLGAYGADYRIRICSGSGAETEVSLADGSERLAVLSCAVEPGRLVTAHLISIGATLVGDEFTDSSYWMLKGILYFDPKRVAGEALNKVKDGQAAESPASAAGPSQPIEQPEYASHRERIVLRSVGMDESRRATSLDEFLQTPDSYWPSEFTSDRRAPIFADHADRRAFYSGCGNGGHVPQVGRINEGIKLTRRSDQFVSMSRLSEGAVFDRSGVWRALGYLLGSPPEFAPWLSKKQDAISIDEESLGAAPYFDGSYLVFYNGHLESYYHWVAEALLCLDILRVTGIDSNLKIVLPKGIERHASFNHRESLQAVGLGGREIVETAADFVRVQEAIWVDSDNIERMPAQYLKDFQQRVAAMYAGVRGPRNRRLLVAREVARRKFNNIGPLQEFLSRYDFETVYLQGMSIVDQILLFQSAEFIIAAHGAGLANLLFCEPGTKVIELMPSVELRPFFWLISAKLGLVHGLQFCDSVGRSSYDSEITVDIGKLQTLIRKLDPHL